MASGNDKTGRVFDRGSGRLFEVPRDICVKHERACARKRKQAQYRKRCSCPREMNWRCDGLCADCPYEKRGNEVSLDCETFDRIHSGWALRHAETARMEDMFEQVDLLDRVIARFRELDSDADTIVSMWRENDRTPESAIARAIGRPQNTFSVQMKRYRAEFRRIRGY